MTSSGTLTDHTYRLAGEVTFLTCHAEDDPAGDPDMIFASIAYGSVPFQRLLRKAVVAGIVAERRSTAEGWASRPCVECDDGADVAGMTCRRCGGVGSLMVPEHVRFD